MIDPINFDKEMGCRIKEFSEKSDIGGVGLIAESVGIGKTTAYSWIAGNIPKQWLVLKKLADSGADINYILTGNRSSHPAALEGTNQPDMPLANLLGLLVEAEMRSGASPKLRAVWLGSRERLYAELQTLLAKLRNEEPLRHAPPADDEQSASRNDRA